MELSLSHIPGVPDFIGARWRVRALTVNGKSPVLSQLAEWSKGEPQNYKKIVASLRLAQTQTRLQSPKHVKKCATHADVYEARADKLHARLMFFYSEDSIIVCTNAFWKTNHGQNDAFKRCSDLKQLYESK